MAITRYEGVTSDILHWRDYLEPGASIYFHDYCDQTPGVIRAIHEFIIDSGRFEDCQVHNGTFCAVRKA